MTLQIMCFKKILVIEKNNVVHINVVYTKF